MRPPPPAAVRGLLVAVSLLALTGCGAGTTRRMWDRPWTDEEPGVGGAAIRTGEVVAKSAATPATLAWDVATDRRVWQAAALVTVVPALVMAAGERSGDAAEAW